MKNKKIMLVLVALATISVWGVCLPMQASADFGKAEIGSDYITLTDVFYIQAHVNKDTKEVANILVKRGKECHSPDACTSTHVLSP
jgi:hypothetical protein